ncbi:adenylyl-sulfate kinase [Burkholderia ubonensis]|uniref:adenylyl-sulfate kinase n=1 Tax=Burkholderia ubonensis TaxID=101571 RepID=UPI000A47ED04|nr:adenylyl-sulfate kinase [Burkholderia ubonensis]
MQVQTITVVAVIDADETTTCDARLGTVTRERLMDKSLVERNVEWQTLTVSRRDRESLQAHSALAVWLTGLPGAGKSTLAIEVERRLHHAGKRTYVLDGDNLRHGLCRDLGFSGDDRAENIRRAGEVARLFVEAGVIVLAAFISPFQVDRAKVRALFEAGDFIEVYCDCDAQICEARDVKGLYRKARAGLISQFTGISSPYEPPRDPDVYVNTGKESVDACVDMIVRRVLHLLR